MMGMPKTGNSSQQRKQQTIATERKAREYRANTTLLATIAKAPDLLSNNLVDSDVKETVQQMRKLQPNEKRYVGGIWLTNPQAAELQQTKQDIAVRERQRAEESKIPSQPFSNKVADLAKRFLGMKTGRTNTQNTDFVAPEKVENNEKSKLLTLREIEVKQNNILSFTEATLNKRFESLNEITSKLLQENIPQIYANQDFVSFLERYLERLESSSKTKTNVTEILKKGKVGRDELKSRIDALYGNNFKMSQQRLLTMFISEQMQYLGKTILNMSKLDDLNGNVEISRGSKLIEIPTLYGDEKAITIHNLTEGNLGKYRENGSNADLFRYLRDVIGPEDFIKIAKNLIGLAIESNKTYNDEIGQIEEITINQQYAKEVMGILNPGPNTQTPDNVVKLPQMNNNQSKQNESLQNQRAA